LEIPPRAGGEKEEKKLKPKIHPKYFDTTITEGNIRISRKKRRKAKK
jgi:hypothetical protein